MRREYTGRMLAWLAAVVSITAADGRAVKAEWSSPGPDAPVVVLVADEGSSPEAWSAVAKALGEAKIATLAIGPRVSATGAESAADVFAALAWAKKRTDADPTRLALAGAGNGAIAALTAAANEPDVDGLALVSASIDRKRLNDDDAMADYGKRPLFVAVSRHDKRPAKSALVLDANGKGRKKLFIAEGARSGAELLAKNFDAQAAFLLWTQETLGLVEVPAETPRPTPEPK